jgi:hypothetical protein
VAINQYLEATAMSNRVAPVVYALAFGAVGLTASPVLAANGPCRDVPTYTDLKAALTAAVDGKNAGLSNEMWATVVNATAASARSLSVVTVSVINGPAAA